MAKTLRPQGGKVVAFVGTAAAANATERREGFFAGAGDSFRVEPKQDALEVFEDGTRQEPGPEQRARPRSASIPTPASSSASGRTTPTSSPRRSPSSPTCGRRRRSSPSTSTSWRARTSPRARSTPRSARTPTRWATGACKLLKALIEKDQKTIDEMLPNGTDTIDTGVRVVVPKKDSPVKGDNVIDIDAMKSWLASKGLKST